MKKFFIIATMLVAAATAVAQDNKKDGDLDNRLFDAKLREMVYRLQLTDEQKARFEPIYRDYDNQMRQLMAPRGHKDFGEDKSDKKMTSQEAAAQLKERFNNQKSAIDLRLALVDKLVTVLDAKQLRQFFRVEQKMQEKLRSHHERGGKRFGGDRKGMHGGGKRGPGMRGGGPRGHRPMGN